MYCLPRCCRPPIALASADPTRTLIGGVLLPDPKELETLAHDPAKVDLLGLYEIARQMFPAVVKEEEPVNSVTFTLHDRRSTGDTTGGGKIPDELVVARIKLKIRLILSYKVEESCAIKLSNRLSLDMLGELNDWFIRKDYYLHKCEVEHKKIRTGAYIAKALDGFFKDHHA